VNYRHLYVDLQENCCSLLATVSLSTVGLFDVSNYLNGLSIFSIYIYPLGIRRKQDELFERELSVTDRHLYFDRY
jgi:hypothetical protein